VTQATDSDRRAGMDVVQGDMAEHQRLTGQEVTAEANRELARDTFAELDAKGTFDAPRPEAVAPPEETRQERRRLEREIEGRKYTVTKDADQSGNPLPMTARERDITVKALKRLHMLLELQDTGILGAPSWRQRACAVMALANDQVRFAQECDALLEESNRYFGDWRVDPERKLIVSG
jgi:hypothetical protein